MCGMRLLANVIGALHPGHAINCTHEAASGSSAIVIGRLTFIAIAPRVKDEVEASIKAPNSRCLSGTVVMLPDAGT